MARFSWSYSKIKNNDVCGRRHYELDLRKPKIFSEPPGDMLAWGDKVHIAMKGALTKTGPLPEEMAPYQKYIDEIQRLPSDGQLFVEQKYALTKAFQPTEYFGPAVWFRGIADVNYVRPPLAIAFDWKTGKIKHDATQLMLMATCVLAYHPNVDYIETRFAWLQDDAVTRERYTRQDITDEWQGMLKRVQAYEADVLANNFPPKPSGLCVRYCPVTSCEFHGKGNRNR